MCTVLARGGEGVREPVRALVVEALEVHLHSNEQKDYIRSTWSDIIQLIGLLIVLTTLQI